MKILALDLALTTGYAVLEGERLIKYGSVKVKVSNWKSNLNDYRQYPKEFPFNLINAANDLANLISGLVTEQAPDLIVIEDTVRGRQRTSQKLLEFIHFAVFSALYGKVPIRLLTVNCWRKELGVFANEEEKKVNSRISKEKKRIKKDLMNQGHSEEDTKRVLAKGVSLDGKRIGRKKSKHFSIRKVKELFDIDLKLNEDDIADSILLACAMRNITDREKN